MRLESASAAIAALLFRPRAPLAEIWSRREGVSAAAAGHRWALAPRRCGVCFRVGHGHRQRVFLGIGSRLLVWRPWSGHRLAGDLEVIHQLGPGPDGRALARLRCVLHQFKQAGITPAVPTGLDPHEARSCLDGHMCTVTCDVRDTMCLPELARNRQISSCLHARDRREAVGLGRRSGG